MLPARSSLILNLSAIKSEEIDNLKNLDVVVSSIVLGRDGSSVLSDISSQTNGEFELITPQNMSSLTNIIRKIAGRSLHK